MIALTMGGTGRLKPENSASLQREQGEEGRTHRSCRQPRRVGKYQPINQSETAIKIGQPISAIRSAQGACPTQLF
jgi:hypothetical protein